MLVSMGQLYGDILYYATYFFDEAVYGATYGRPERFYFWVYFVMLNGFWIIIPLWLISQSVLATSNAFQVASKLSRSKAK
jgi:cholestenol delta-isomerase